MLLIGSGFAVGCGSASFKSTGSSPSGAPSGANVIRIDVNGGPEVGQPGGGIYQNVPFATAKVCAAREDGGRRQVPFGCGVLRRGSGHALAVSRGRRFHLVPGGGRRSSSAWAMAFLYRDDWGDLD